MWSFSKQSVEHIDILRVPIEEVVRDTLPRFVFYLEELCTNMVRTGSITRMMNVVDEDDMFSTEDETPRRRSTVGIHTKRDSMSCDNARIPAAKNRQERNIERNRIVAFMREQGGLKAPKESEDQKIRIKNAKKQKKRMPKVFSVCRMLLLADAKLRY